MLEVKFPFNGGAMKIFVSSLTLFLKVDFNLCAFERYRALLKVENFQLFCRSRKIKIASQWMQIYPVQVITKMNILRYSLSARLQFHFDFICRCVFYNKYYYGQ